MKRATLINRNLDDAYETLNLLEIQYCDFGVLDLCDFALNPIFVIIGK